MHLAFVLPLVLASGLAHADVGRIVTPPPPDPNGERTAEQISAAIYARRKEFQSCYTRLNSKQAGKVVVQFKIGKTGSVASARVTSSTLKSKALDGCLIRTMKSITFPAAEGISTVNFPFVFARA